MSSERLGSSWPVDLGLFSNHGWCVKITWAFDFVSQFHLPYENLTQSVSYWISSQGQALIAQIVTEEPELLNMPVRNEIPDFGLCTLAPTGLRTQAWFFFFFLLMSSGSHPEKKDFPVWFSRMIKKTLKWNLCKQRAGEIVQIGYGLTFKCLVFCLRQKVSKLQ